MCLTAMMDALTQPSNLGCQVLFMPETFAQWLARNRQEKGETLVSLGLKAGVSDAMISMLETGKREPTRKMVPKIAAALGANVSQTLVIAGFVPTDPVSGVMVPELSRELDPDYLPTPEGYSGLDGDGREYVREAVQLSVEAALRRQRRRESIGGKIAGDGESNRIIRESDRSE
jgi:transcriptional regulator with XRE-family HTH domain